MKSVGEVMAIGRTFEEAIQKGLRMIGLGMHGFIGNKDIEFEDVSHELNHPTDIRIFAIAKAFNEGWSIEQIYEQTKIDRWFLHRLRNIFDHGEEISGYNQFDQVPDELLLNVKKLGFSDYQLSRLILKREMKGEASILSLREYRKSKGIRPYVKQIDTLAAEYPAQTNYLYLTYNAIEDDVKYVGDRKSVIVLGSGAYRIGSSVEFDWCGVNALNAIRKEGYRAIMINYNPETVSTDYDVCDRLYFDELSFERVLDIIDLENPKGVIISTGGQIPNNLAMRLHKQNVHILGTSALSIDRAEDRHKFSQMLDDLKIDQPEWRELITIDEIYGFADQVGYPLLVRPSYVLAGAAMNIVSNSDELSAFLKLAALVSKDYPVVVSKFIENAKEVEVDAVAKDGEIIIYAISEHVEFAGVHSGDATIVFPPQNLYVETVRRIKRVSSKIAKELNISGPFNIQFLARGNDIKVIECNLRASRSFPFVSKILKTNLIEIATRIMLDLPVSRPNKSIFDLDYIGVKASQFSFSRLHMADPVLGVDMVSTGEVGCIGEDYYEAILKAMLSVGYKIPEKGILFSSGPTRSKIELIESAKDLVAMGYHLYATKGTHLFFEDNDVPTTMLHWPDAEEEPNVLTYLKKKKIDLVINIPKNLSKKELDNDYTIRRLAVDLNIPLITNARLASAFITAFHKYKLPDLMIKSWDEY
jgi:carbamoyl-phosphate synthase large subunit